MDQQFSLSWNNFHGNLTKGFAGLLGKGEFVDVTIAVEGQLLQAHKVILSICSPYFKKMFQLNPCQHPIVVLRDVTHKAMRDLLQFMYHGEVSVKREDLTTFIGTAEVLQIKGLTNKETEDEIHNDSADQEQDLSKHNKDRDAQNNRDNQTPDDLSCISDTFENTSEETLPNNETDLTKQREFIEKLQRLSTLKRKSEEFLQKNYYSDLLTVEKRPKVGLYKQSNNYEPLKSLYDDTPLDATKNYNAIKNINKEINGNIKCKTLTQDCLDLKTECEDTDIIVTDPAACTTPKHFENSREKKDLSLPLDFQSPQDNCTGLNSLFMDLKNLVNGKVGNLARPNTLEDYSRTNLEHRLVTIPQKEDGKKKYPQRSCRLCWKIGKRRDTRFMCNACELPFCKSPCFDVHYNDIIKLAQFQGALSLVINVCESQHLPVRYKYIYSRKGHKQLVYKNFVYTKHSTTHGKTSWRCVQYFSLNRCPATVETIDAMIFAVNHQHNHEDSYEKLANNSIYEMNEPEPSNKRI